MMKLNIKHIECITPKHEVHVHLKDVSEPEEIEFLGYVFSKSLSWTSGEPDDPEVMGHVFSNEKTHITIITHTY